MCVEPPSPGWRNRWNSRPDWPTPSCSQPAPWPTGSSHSSTSQFFGPNARIGLLIKPSPQGLQPGQVCHVFPSRAVRRNTFEYHRYATGTAGRPDPRHSTAPTWRIPQVGRGRHSEVEPDGCVLGGSLLLHPLLLLFLFKITWEGLRSLPFETWYQVCVEHNCHQYDDPH